MKNFLIFTVLIINFCHLSGQSVYEDSLLTNKMEQLKNSGIKDIVSISYESYKSIIIWDNSGKINALKICKSNSKQVKIKKIRLNRKQKVNFENCLTNYDLIGQIDNKDCAEARSFVLISIKALINGNYRSDYSFYSHCGTKEQRDNIEPLLNLYYDFL